MVVQLPRSCAGDTVEQFVERHPRQCAETELDPLLGETPQLGDTALVHDPALAQHGDARRNVLDLGQHVGGEEHSCAGLALLADDGEDLALYEGIQAARRLVQNQQVRPVHDRLDDADLAPVAGREFPDPPGAVESEPLAQGDHMCRRHTPAKVAVPSEQLADLHPLVQRGVPGQVAGGSTARARHRRGPPPGPLSV